VLLQFRPQLSSLHTLDVLGLVVWKLKPSWNAIDVLELGVGQLKPSWWIVSF
jgi:hypothetical protein